MLMVGGKAGYNSNLFHFGSISFLAANKVGCDKVFPQINWHYVKTWQQQYTISVIEGHHIARFINFLLVHGVTELAAALSRFVATEYWNYNRYEYCIFDLKSKSFEGTRDFLYFGKRKKKY